MVSKCHHLAQSGDKISKKQTLFKLKLIPNPVLIGHLEAIKETKILYNSNWIKHKQSVISISAWIQPYYLIELNLYFKSKSLDNHNDNWKTHFEKQNPRVAFKRICYVCMYWTRYYFLKIVHCNKFCNSVYKKGKYEICQKNFVPILRVQVFLSSFLTMRIFHPTRWFQT